MALFTPLPTPPGLPPSFATPSPGGQRPPQSMPITTPLPYDNLLETKWRTNSFPCISFQEQNTFDLVEHKYPHLDNARLDNTGFNPRIWTLVIPFTNNIYPSPNETWLAGNLYPNTWNIIQNDFRNNKSSGTLQHPQLGAVTAKLHTYEFRMADKPRDGIIVTARFIECLPDDQTISETNAEPTSGLYNLTASTNSLENALSDPTLDPRLAPPGLNLLGKFTQMAAYLRSVAAYPNAVATSINAQALAFASTAEGTINDLQNAPTIAYQTGLSLYNLDKNVQLGIMGNYNTNFFPTTKLSQPISITGGRPPTTNRVVYNGQALGKLLSSYQSAYNTNNMASSNGTNNTTSGSVPTAQTQAITKCIQFVQAAIGYYQSLNNNQTASIVQGMYQVLANLIQISSGNGGATASTNKGNNYAILSFVPQNRMTFLEIAHYTNNTIDQIMSLNITSNSLVFVTSGTQVFYYSATGA